MLIFHREKNILSAFLLLSLASLITLSSSQLNCSNYYNSANLPSKCSTDNLTCYFPSLSNSSLIINDTNPGQYGICIDLP